MKHFYVYKITNIDTQHFYIGYRSIRKNKDPLDDLGISYFTSGRLRLDFKNTPHKFEREILFTSEFKSEAYNFEQLLIKSHFSNRLCENRNFTVKKLPATGKLKVLKKRDKLLKRGCLLYCDLETRAIVYIYP